MKKIKPRIFENPEEWIKKINREWQFRPAVALHGSVKPNVVEAASGHTFIVTLEAGQGLTIPAGGHITMEIPATWVVYLGNCFRRGVRTVGNLLGGKIAPDFSRVGVSEGKGNSMNNHPMGTDISVELDSIGPRIFSLCVVGTYRIDTVEIIRNNEVVFSVNPGKDVWKGEWTDTDQLSAVAFEPILHFHNLANCATLVLIEECENSIFAGCQTSEILCKEENK